MSTKNTDVAAEVKVAAETKTETSKCGVSLYVGPSIKGVIQTKKIIRGVGEEALKDPEVALAIQQRPAIKDLIIPATDWPTAREDLKDKNTPMAKAYKRVAKGEDIKKEDN